jgi:hypothetical protein
MKDRLLREEFINEVYAQIAKSDLKIFGVELNKYQLYTNSVVSSKDDIYRIAFQKLLVGVNLYVSDYALDRSIVVMIDSIDRNHNRKIYSEYQKAIYTSSGVLHSIGTENERLIRKKFPLNSQGEWINYSYIGSYNLE